MNRLINADKLKKDILGLKDCYNGFSDAYDKDCIISVIDEQPTIEERKKGKWINHLNDEGHNIADCDQCGETMQWYDPDPKPNYCPNCGCKMED